jgi:capsule polysaccharide modification protein KpsS
MGPFFHRFAQDLECQGLHVYKVNFNGGDDFFYPHHGAIHFIDDLQQWPDFLKHILKGLAIDRIYLFGDCRPYHVIARNIAKHLGIPVFVFEEGYLRPDYITIEKEGVNGFSRLPQDPIEYPVASRSPTDTPIPVGHSFSWMAIYAQLYYIASRLSRRYPQYVHHRPLNVFSEGSKWIFSAVAKLWFKFTERTVGLRLSSELAGNYFLVPLQVHCDMQIRCHSPYKSVEQFIIQLINSFAAHAPPEDYLVFKHHPLDRGYRNYSNLIRRVSESSGIRDRVIYVHDLPLPALFKHAQGTVVINSTAALSSIHHGIPVKVLGRAVYDLKGLTSQLTLARFWSHPERPDKNLYLKFRAYLVTYNQINGNFYKRLPNVDNALGVIWPGCKGGDVHVQPTIPSERLKQSM